MTNNLTTAVVGAYFISSVIRFALDFFVHFVGFEGEYSKYLTEKRMKWAEKDNVKMVAILMKQAPWAGHPTTPAVCDDTPFPVEGGITAPLCSPLTTA